jgi:hypothetical protein
LDDRLIKTRHSSTTVHGVVLKAEVEKATNLSAEDFERILRKCTSQEPATSGLFEFTKEFESKLLRMFERVTGKSKEDPEVFNWEKRRPRVLYHADSWVQSLEDTPKVFAIKQTSNVKIRANVHAYLYDVHHMPTPDWSLASIGTSIPAKELRDVSCVDYALNSNSFDMPEIRMSLAGRVSRTFWGRSPSGSDSQLVRILNSQPGLWDFYFLGKCDENSKLFSGLSSVDKERLQDKIGRERFMNKFRDMLFKVLNDSVCPVRVLFAALTVLVD